MSVPATHRSPTLQAGRIPVLTLGMVLFLGSELMFFSALFGMYFTLRGLNAANWPPAGTDLPLLTPTIFTAFLLASSCTMQIAVRRVRGGDARGMRRWVRLTILLGLAFLVGQGSDYAKATFQISSGAYGSAFYTMTGFHALHVFAGLAIMVVILGRSAAGAYSADDHAGVEAAAYYWHFVDVVWLGLYATIFLIR
jgi:cytochrome c oxidase subunit III